MKSTPAISIRFMAALLSAVFLLPAVRSPADTPTSSAASAPLNTLTEAERKAGWILLFDGKTTKGWRSYRQQAINPGWKVIDGALTRTNDGAGDIVTVEKYGSFELSLEHNIPRGGNSGVMFHVTEDGEYPWHTGPEVQIVDNKEGRDLQLSGWLYALYSSPVDATKPAGQWNRLRIIVAPEKCETHLNDVKYYEYVKGSKDWDNRVSKTKFAKFPNFGKAARGHIALQDHNAAVAFRNIKIRSVPDK